MVESAQLPTVTGSWRKELFQRKIEELLSEEGRDVGQAKTTNDQCSWCLRS